MRESPAWRVLSASAKKLIERIELEHAHHGGTENGRLPVTYNDFVRHGIDRHAVSPALAEAVALGFVEVTERGRGGNAEFRRPNLFGLTFRAADSVLGDGSHEWRRIETMEDARRIRAEARHTAAERERRKRAKKRKSSGGKRTGSGGVTPTDNRQSPVGVRRGRTNTETPTLMARDRRRVSGISSISRSPPRTLTKRASIIRRSRQAAQPLMAPHPTASLTRFRNSQRNLRTQLLISKSKSRLSSSSSILWVTCISRCTVRIITIEAATTRGSLLPDSKQETFTISGIRSSSSSSDQMRKLSRPI